METVTLKQIAEEAHAAGEPWLDRRRLAYACEAYRIEPVQRAGMVRLFARADVSRILSAARRVAGRGCRG
jgi:hypothetical protein